MTMKVVFNMNRLHKEPKKNQKRQMASIYTYKLGFWFHYF